MKFWHAQKIHFVGIGGIGMSGIAEVLLNLNYTVTGSDTAISPIIRRLRKLGGKIAIGHKASNLGEADVVVTSSAISLDNVEVQESLRRKIPVIPRAEMLGELMRLKQGIAISGSHGKTSITSMVATVLSKCRLDPTIVIGGKLGMLRSSAKLGKGDLMVAEADESDGSFLKLNPTIAVVANIDREHLDFYKNLEEIKRAFIHFLNRVPFYGVGIICLDDENTRQIIPMLERKIMTYGTTRKADLYASHLTWKQFHASYTAHFKGKKLGKVMLRVPGKHNILNSLATLAVGLECGLEFKKIAQALHDFRGAERRFQLKGEVQDIMVIDDYGHHPQEIVETLSAAKRGLGRNIVAIFQPHRYTRVKALIHDFSKSFDNADSLIVTDIYPAGEKPLRGITGERVAKAIKKAGHQDVTYVQKLEDIVPRLRKIVQPGDLVITLGAGNVWKVGGSFLKALLANPEEAKGKKKK
jgi:UDP-N-acetylmuramate--alanine ligase